MNLIRLFLVLCLAVSALAQSAASRFPQSVTFTITSGQTTSAAVNMAGCTAAAIETPAALTGTSLTFSVSNDGGTYTTLYDEFGSTKTVSVGTSRTILLSPADWWFIRWMKIVSSGTEAGTRIFKVVCRY